MREADEKIAIQNVVSPGPVHRADRASSCSLACLGSRSS